VEVLTNAVTRVNLLWPTVPAGEMPTEIRLAESERVVWPRLYYVHQCVDYKPEEGTDIFGRIVRVSTCEIVCPLCIWDSPTAVTERVMIGVGFFWEFR
jgi:hypothetical protein